MIFRLTAEHLLFHSDFVCARVFVVIFLLYFGLMNNFALFSLQVAMVSATQPYSVQSVRAAKEANQWIHAHIHILYEYLQEVCGNHFILKRKDRKREREREKKRNIS